MDPIIIAYAALIVLIGVVWGLTSLWAVTSQLPAGLRLLALSALLAPLVTVPAFEPILFFSIQTAVLLCGVLLWRWQRGRHSSGRFALKDLLLFVVVTALWCSVLARCEVSSLQVWLALLSGGFAIGMTTLAAAWVSLQWSVRRWFVAGIAVAVVAIPVGIWETTILNLPEWERASVGPLAPVAAYTQSLVIYIAWLSVLELILLLTLVGLVLSGDSRSYSPRRLAGLVVFWCLLLIPIVWVFWNTPKRRVQPELAAGPDGYQSFREAQDLYVGNVVLDESEPATDQQLETALKLNETTFAKLQEAVTHPFHWDRPEFEMNQLVSDAQSLRSFARMYGADAELSIRRKQYDRVVDNGMTVMELATRAEDANLLMSLVANAVHAMGRHYIARVRNRFDSAQAMKLIEGLTKLESRAPSIDEIVEADRLWADRQYRWRSQLYNGLSNAFQIDALSSGTDAVEAVKTRSSAARRLLAMDMAIRVFQRTKGRLPDSMDELSKLIDPLMLSDPYSNQEKIKYSITSVGGYLLYCVGPDGKDDGGKPIPGAAFDGKGDISVDVACGKVDADP